MTYEDRSHLHTKTSFLVRSFFAIVTLIGLLMGAVVHADPADQTGDTQLNPDTDPPVVTTNIADGQELSGTVPIVETIYEDSPQEYAIKLANPDGSDVIVNGATVGVIQNPAIGDELTFGWDTTTVANGMYQVVLSARDQAGNSQTKTIQVSVNNPETPPTYPPITSELTPIPDQALAPPRLTPPKTTPPPTSAAQPDKVLGEQIDDQLARRLPETAIPRQTPRNPADTCARFFGVCWYYSVPATVAVSAGALWLYRLRNRGEA